MFEFWLSSLHTYGYVLFNTSYFVENGALLHDIMWSWKMIVRGHGKSWKSHGKFLGKSVGTLYIVH